MKPFLLVGVVIAVFAAHGLASEDPTEKLEGVVDLSRHPVFLYSA